MVTYVLRIVPKGLERELEQLKIGIRIGTILTNTVEIGQNKVKSPEGLWRLAVTQNLVKEHQPTQLGKHARNENNISFILTISC